MSMQALFSHVGFRKYFQNTGWLFFGRILSLVIYFIVNIYITRYLGPEHFGVLSFAVSLVALCAVFSNLGLDSIVARELVAENLRPAAILGTAFLMKLVSAIGVVLLISVCAHFFITDSLTRVVLAVVSFGTLFQPFSVIESYLNASLKAKINVFVQLGTMIVLSVTKLYLIFSHASVVAFAWTYVLEAVCMAVFLVWAYAHAGLRMHAWKPAWRTAAVLWTSAWPLLLSGVAYGVYMKIDQVMIRYFLDFQAVGVYSVAVRLSEVWYFIPALITTSLFPALVSANKVHEEMFTARMKKLYALMSFLALALVIPISVFSGTIIVVLYGPGFQEAAVVLRIYVWAGLAVFLGTAANQFLIIRNLTKIYFFTTSFGMVLNIGLNLFLIPRYGILGAAVATVISYTAATFSVVFFRRSRLQAWLMLRSVMPSELFNRNISL